MTPMQVERVVAFIGLGLVAASASGGDRHLVIEGFGGIAGIAVAPELDRGKAPSRPGLGFAIGYQVHPRIQVRIDASRTSWAVTAREGGLLVCENADAPGWGCPGPGLYRFDESHTQTLRRTLFFAGLRYETMGGDAPLRPYVELGALVGPIRHENDRTRTTTSLIGAWGPGLTEASGSEGAVKLGVAPGAGIRLRMSRDLDLMLGARYPLLAGGLGSGPYPVPRLSALDLWTGIALHFH